MAISFGGEFDWVRKNKPKGRVVTSGVLADGNRNTVQTAIDAVSSGSASKTTITIPNGTWEWTEGISIFDRLIHLRGETENGVTIIDSLPAGDGAVISIGESTLGHNEVSRINFNSEDAPGRNNTTNCHVSIFGTTGGRALLIHNNRHIFSMGGGTNCYYSNVNRGVFFQNTATADVPTGIVGWRNTFSLIRLKNATGLVSMFGEAGWNSPSTLGTLDTTGEKNLYLEDNTYTNMHEGTDFDDACRVVFRYNQVNSSTTMSHGYDTSPLGSRQCEVYGNTYVYGSPYLDFSEPGFPGGIPANIESLVDLRGGGVWVIHNNIIPNVTSSEFGDRAEIRMLLYGLRTNVCYNDNYPMPRQHGYGHNGTIQIQDPIYIWNNLITPGGADTPAPQIADFNGDPCGNNRFTSEFVQLNRDYYVGTAKPGYTAYTYPHPLRSQAS